MYYVYILQCSDASLYTGTTNDVQRRLKVHESGKGSKYVRAKSPFKLVYKEELEDKSSALKREAQIKKLSKKEKTLLVSSSQVSFDS